MKIKNPKLLATLASTGILTGQALAVTYTEPGDAGQTPAMVQSTGLSNGVSLTAISGNLSSMNDADLYQFQITSATAFSVSTVGGSTLDTALFLFTSTGVAIAANDDGNGTTVQSTLASGNSLYANLAPGTYFLGISLSGNEPVNTANQLLFDGYPGGDTTATRGAAAGVNPTTLSDFNGLSSDVETATAYTINLTGSATAVPEPSAWAAMLVGGAAAAFAFMRRRSIA